MTGHQLRLDDVQLADPADPEHALVWRSDGDLADKLPGDDPEIRLIRLDIDGVDADLGRRDTSRAWIVHRGAAADS